MSFDRPKKQRKERAEPDPEEKRKYQEEANQFAMSLVEGLGDQDGKSSVLMDVGFFAGPPWRLSLQALRGDLAKTFCCEPYYLLHVAPVCTPCCILLHVAGSCCTKFETKQTQKILNISFVS